MTVAASGQRHTRERQIQSVMPFLVPFFFIETGAQVDIGTLASWSAFGMLVLVTLLAVVSKLGGADWECFHLAETLPLSWE